MRKDKIITITGPSGSGKTFAAEFIEEVYGILMIQSWTDRPKRYENENGHTFISKEEFDKLDVNDMIALTNFGGYRYCCLKSDVKDINTYVIDDKGVDYLEEHYKDVYDIVKIYINRPLSERKKIVDEERLKRDEKMFYKPLSDFDYVIQNDSDIENFKKQIKIVIRDITKK